MVVNLLVEGVVDDAVGRRLLHHVGVVAGVTFGKRGADYIRGKVQAFARGARDVPLLVLADFMDANLACAPSIVQEWLPHPEPNCVFRVAVREIESWLLADSAGMARLLGVAKSRITMTPEELPDPKAELIRLAQMGSRKARRELVPAPGTSAATGILYNSTLADFASTRWDPVSASMHSVSLSKGLSRLGELAGRLAESHP